VLGSRLGARLTGIEVVVRILRADVRAATAPIGA
jgi:hypothetical protein